jgi:membrane protein DedA with SNARE-associated domain
MTQLISIALATLVSEDLTCIAAGALVAEGMLGFFPAVFACIAGIFTGDVLLFLAGRYGGRHALRFIPAEKVDRASRWLLAKGPAVVLASRFTPGLRTATYFAAGLLRTNFRSFSGYFLLATVIWTPLAVGGAAIFGKGFGSAWLSGAAVAGFLIFRVARRQVVGFFKRLVRWEFWPMWAAYLPFMPYFVWLTIRFRSTTLFTAANPGIETGGFVSESKSAILAQLPRAADFAVVRGCGAREMQELGLDFPVVLKPDVGERGEGVAVIRSVDEMHSYLANATGDIILQRYVSGLEFGVFYYRYPHESRGRIFSITEKRFPELTGDGQRTLRELIWSDTRAACIANTYEKLSKRPLSDVPLQGEQVKLVEIGSHCRGAIFVDAIQHKTEALEREIDQSAKNHEGFYFGRFDVRTPSVEAFQRGEFTILELNGVGAEAAHIYDPSVSLLDAYRTMFSQWRVAFEIGAENRKRGFQPMSPRTLIGLMRDRKETTPLQPCRDSLRSVLIRSTGRSLFGND